MPTNLQQRKDSFRLKFRAPARGTSHDHPQSQVGRKKKTVRGEEGRWYAFSTASHGSCVICLHVETARPRPCTSGFPMTRAAELKPSDFPGGARPCPDHRLLSGIQWFLVAPWPPALTEKISAGGQHAQAWGAGRSLHGLSSERCRLAPQPAGSSPGQDTFRCVGGDCFHPTPGC